MAGDFAATLRPWAVNGIVINGNDYRIPAHAADVWLEHIATSNVNLWDIIPGMLEPAADDDVTEALLNGELDRESFEDLVWEVVASAAGCPWWEALYLIGAAIHPVNTRIVRGRLALHGVNATKISLASWLDAVYAIFTENMDAQARQKFDAALQTPPRGTKAKINKEAQAANFKAAMNM